MKKLILIEKKRIKLILFLSILLLLSACTSNKENEGISVECKNYAEKILPEYVDLEFRNAFSGPSSPELPYRLTGIKYMDGTTNFQDRDFRLPTTAGKKKGLYYPIKESDVIEHSRKIEYKNNDIIIVFDLVLKPTNEIKFVERENVISKKIEEDRNQGTRKFKIEDYEILQCNI